MPDYSREDAQQYINKMISSGQLVFDQEQISRQDGPVEHMFVKQGFVDLATSQSGRNLLDYYQQKGTKIEVGLNRQGDTNSGGKQLDGTIKIDPGKFMGANPFSYVGRDGNKHEFEPARLVTHELLGHDATGLVHDDSNTPSTRIDSVDDITNKVMKQINPDTVDRVSRYIPPAEGTPEYNRLEAGYKEYLQNNPDMPANKVPTIWQFGAGFKENGQNKKPYVASLSEDALHNPDPALTEIITRIEHDENPFAMPIYDKNGNVVQMELDPNNKIYDINGIRKTTLEEDRQKNVAGCNDTFIGGMAADCIDPESLPPEPEEPKEPGVCNDTFEGGMAGVCADPKEPEKPGGGGGGKEHNPDIDGDGTPNSEDKDIDGDGKENGPDGPDDDNDNDGIKNDEDKTPNGEEEKEDIVLPMPADPHGFVPGVISSDPLFFRLDGEQPELSLFREGRGYKYGGHDIDWDNDGYLEAASRMAEGDYMLVIDLDGDGVVKEAREIFSDNFNMMKFPDAVAAMKLLLPEGEHIFDENNQFFSVVKAMDSEENLHGLKELGIKSIDLNATPVLSREEINENEVVSYFDITMENGNVIKGAAVSLDMDPVGYSFDPLEEVLPENIQVLTNPYGKELAVREIHKDKDGNDHVVFRITADQPVNLVVSPEDLPEGYKGEVIILGNNNFDIKNHNVNVSLIDNPVIIEQGEGPSATIGGTGFNSFKGFGGNDFQDGRLGAKNVMKGDHGNDTQISGEGPDTIDGGYHDDFQIAGNGDDMVIEGLGSGKSAGNEGNDIVFGGEFPVGGSGDALRTFQRDQSGSFNPAKEISRDAWDIVNQIYDPRGKPEKEIMHIVTPTFDYHDGDDEVFGGEGNDIVSSQSGNDKEMSGPGNNILLRSDGNDIKYIGNGNNLIGVGRHSNEVVFGKDIGEFNVVVGFKPFGEFTDKIHFNGTEGISSAADLNSFEDNITISGDDPQIVSGTSVQLPQGQKIFFVGVSKADLDNAISQNNFVFHEAAPGQELPDGLHGEQVTPVKGKMVFDEYTPVSSVLKPAYADSGNVLHDGSDDGFTPLGAQLFNGASGVAIAADVVGIGILGMTAGALALKYKADIQQALSAKENAEEAGDQEKTTNPLTYEDLLTRSTESLAMISPNFKMPALVGTLEPYSAIYKSAIQEISDLEALRSAGKLLGNDKYVQLAEERIDSFNSRIYEQVQKLHPGEAEKGDMIGREMIENIQDFSRINAVNNISGALSLPVSDGALSSTDGNERVMYLLNKEEKLDSGNSNALKIYAEELYDKVDKFPKLADNSISEKSAVETGSTEKKPGFVASIKSRFQAATPWSKKAIIRDSGDIQKIA